MNLPIPWSSIQPLLGQLLQNPQFQALLMKLLTDAFGQISAGVHPDTVAQQAMGKIGAGALLHLTGNPVADFSALLAGLKPPTGAPPPAGTYTS